MGGKSFDNLLTFTREVALKVYQCNAGCWIPEIVEKEDSVLCFIQISTVQVLYIRLLICPQ